MPVIYAPSLISIRAVAKKERTSSKIFPALISHLIVRYEQMFERLRMDRALTGDVPRGLWAHYFYIPKKHICHYTIPMTRLLKHTALLILAVWVVAKVYTVYTTTERQ